MRISIGNNRQYGIIYSMSFRYSSITFAIAFYIAVLVVPRFALCEELPDDIRFFDTNEEFDTLDVELGESQDVIIELYLDVGSYFYDNGQFGDAITTYASALDRDLKCGDAWYGLARCYAQTSEFDKAVAALEKAIFLEAKSKEKARSDAAFEELKTLPRFKAVVGEGE